MTKFLDFLGLGKASYPEQVNAYSEQDIEQLGTKNHKSFPSLLPYTEYLTDTETFLLEDGFSHAIVFTVKPVPTEGRSTEMLAEMRNKIQGIFENEIQPKQKHPWIVQEFAYQESEIVSVLDDMKANVSPEAKGTEYTKKYFKLMEKHLKGIANPDGIFKDELTQKQWKGEQRRCKFIVYRRSSPSEIKDPDYDPAEEILSIREGIERQFTSNRIGFKRDNGIDFFNWLLLWFNPGNALADSKDSFMKLLGIDKVEDLPFGFDLSEALIHSPPRVDVKNNCWWFDEMPHAVIRSAKFNKRPEIGQLSGEIANGVGTDALTNSFMDGLPAGTVIAKTMVMMAQHDTIMQADALESKCRGGSQAAGQTLNAINGLKESLINKQNVCRLAVAVYVRGKDLPELRKRCRDITASLFSGNITSYKLQEDSLANKAYIDLLPMNFYPNKDPKNRVARLCYLQHAINLSLIWGRAEGTGNVAQIEFNRGGSPITYDQFDRDKVNNAFELIIGPPGSGKSAKLVDKILTLMAVYRPRMFIVEKGNSFSLAGKYLQQNGVTVNRVSITPGSGTSLPPFADSHLIFEQEAQAGFNEEGLSDNIYQDLEEDSDEEEDDDQRDVMGEMEVSAMLMITGGEVEEQKKYGRAERGLLRRCIRNTAVKCRDAERMMLTQDLRDELKTAALDENTPPKHREKLADMSSAIDSYTTGFGAELFNREGQPWVDADVTIVDLGTLTKDGYEAELALTYVSLMMKINSIAEKNQSSGRHNIVLTDEAHIITTNPLLASFLVKAVKMMRKLTTWPIFATQNLKDFPDNAAKLLNMIEWWQMLTPTKNEIEQLERFRELSEEQKSLMKNCRKQSRAYTEGVIFSDSVKPTLFRSVPPSLHLVLAGSDGKEKKALRVEREAIGSNDVGAAISLANKLDKMRGIDAES
ncbi:conjugative transfer ATPase [Shewanella sp. MBTL60-007]|uniref:conjugative transfer ATPase n=1 Tax=Shewanella sp. MBTL60-007 TaxID=2815911 RepID=UPI001C7FF274|nr:conjugative transfer ATPase [Shewanella sp. MBTL60-007]